MARAVAPHPLRDRGVLSVLLLMVGVGAAGDGEPTTPVAPPLLAKAAAGILLPTMPAAAVGDVAGIDDDDPSPAVALSLPPVDGLATPPTLWAAVAPSVAGGGQVGRVLNTTRMGSVAALVDGRCFRVGRTATGVCISYSRSASALANLCKALLSRR